MPSANGARGHYRFLYGGKTPYVLREDIEIDGSLQRDFEFNGECFIHGYMEPGIVDASKLRHYPDEIFWSLVEDVDIYE